jgi:hypothetical protein
MYWTGWMPTCPGHVLDRLGDCPVHALHSTGWVPSSCTGPAGCPVHVLDRLGAQFMYSTVDRLGTQFMYRTG